MPSDVETQNMTLNQLALAGLALNLAGVLLLFRFGLPGGIVTGGGGVITTRATDDGIKKEWLYIRLGYVGLACTVIGTALQAPVLL